MSISGKITRFNMHQLPPYERMQHLRARRMEAAAIAEKHAAFASSFAGIQQNNTAEIGNLISRIAMQRMSKLA
jgi:hypothetical protein